MSSSHPYTIRDYLKVYPLKIEIAAAELPMLRTILDGLKLEFELTVNESAASDPAFILVEVTSMRPKFANGYFLIGMQLAEARSALLLQKTAIS